MSSTTLPIVVPIVIVGVDIIMAVLLFLGVLRLARQPGVVVADPTIEEGRRHIQRLGWRLAGLISVWAAAALFLTFAVVPLALPPFVVPAFIAAVVATGYMLATHTTTGRALLHAAPQPWLIGAQVYRCVGGVFLIAASVDALPAYFALPAGWGDLLTGAGAVAVAVLWTMRWAFARPAALLWNLFGLGDLLLAIGIGSGLVAGWAAGIFGGTPVWLEQAVAGFQIFAGAIFPISYPLALIPTFVVPLGIVLHLLSLRKLATEREVARGDAPSPLTPAPRAA